MSMLRQWIKSLGEKLLGGTSRRSRRPRSAAAKRKEAAKIRPTFDVLEDRLVPSTVTNLNDSGVGSLRYEIANTPSGGTITFAGGLSGNILLNSTLSITSNVDIQGPATFNIGISGQNAVQDIVISGGANVTIANMAVDYGAAASGGGIAVNGGQLSLSNDDLGNNYASYIGGAIFVANANSSLSMYEDSLVDNTAKSSGGAVYSYQGTTTLSDCNVEYNQCSFEGPNGQGEGVGGGICANGGSLTLTYDTIQYNSAPYGGGGGVSDSGVSSNTLTLSNDTISDNSCAFTGGGVFTEDMTVNMNNDTIAGNTANDSFESNPGAGGGLYLDESLVTMSTVTIANNIAPYGGGMLNSSGSGNSQLSNVDVTGNTSSVSGGGIFNDGTLTVNSSAFASNSAGALQSGNGGGLVNNGTLTLSNSIVTDNTTSGNGGGIWNGGTLTANSCQFTSNSAPTDVSSRGDGGGIFNSSAAAMTLNSSTFTDNSAGVSGGGFENSGEAAMYGGALYGNIAHVSGGGVYSYGGSTTLSGCTIANNQGSNVGNGQGDGAGGGVGAVGGSLTLSYDSIQNNSASYGSGGGVCAGSFAGSSNTLTLSNDTISDNSCAIQGGGVCAAGDTVTITNVTIAGNNASDDFAETASDGGGLFLYGNPDNLTNVTIANNFADYGGGVYGSFGTLMMTNVTIANNNAEYGGGVCGAEQVNMNNVTIANNYAGFDGGGVYETASLNMSNVTVADNTAGYEGGGIFASGGVAMDNTIVASNTSYFGPGYGIDICAPGGVYAYFSLIGTTDDYSIINSGGNNQTGVSAGLSSLVYNGGLTETVALMPGSAAIGAGDPSQAGTTAQNDVTRPSTPDIGAYQTAPTPIVTSSQNPLADSSMTITINGSNFQPAGSDTVAFNLGVEGTVTSATTDQLVVALSSAPDARGALTAVVTSDGVTSGAPVEVATVTNGTWIVTDPSGGAGTQTDVTLPYAVASALSGDAITFAGSLNEATIYLSSTLTINSNVTISGLGAANLAVSGNNSVEVFDVASGITASISGLTIENGNASSGGGVNNYGALTLRADSFTGNYANNGGAVSNEGTLILTDSTFAANVAANYGGGFQNYGAAATVDNCTFFGNSAYYGGAVYTWSTITMADDTVSGNTATVGGGFFNYAGQGRGTASLDNTIIAGNTIIGGNTGEDTYCDYPFAAVNYSLIGTASNFSTSSGGNNQIGASANLDSLAYNNGAPTQTLALLAGSAALGTGDPSQASTTSQNGVVRPATPDIGAYQTAPTPTVTSATQNVADSSMTVTINGLNFDPTPGNDSVAFNLGVEGTVASASANRLVVTLSTAPDALGALTAVVTSNGQSSGGPMQVATVTNGTWLVTDSSGGAGSQTDITLPYAVASALSGDTITFSSNLLGATIDLNSTLTVDTSVTITGLGAANLAVSGQGSVQDFNVGIGVTASISGLTIENGYQVAIGSSGGGGIFNNGTLTLSNDMITANNSYYGGGISNIGTITINDATIALNQANWGGGIQNIGLATISNSTIYQNYATSSGGGTWNQGTLALTSDTIAGNASGSGGGISAHFGTVTIDDTIVAGNDTEYDGPDIDGSVAANYSLIGNTSYATISGANNVENVSAGLASLLAYNNGAPTETLALLPGSPAFATGDPSQAGTTSQNGVIRPSNPDIGAYQTASGATPTVTSTISNSIADSSMTVTINGSNFDPTPGNDTVAFNLGVEGTVTSATASQLIVTLSTAPGALGALTAVVTSGYESSGAPAQVATVTNGTWIVTDGTADGAGTQTDVTLTYAATNYLGGDTITFANGLSAYGSANPIIVAGTLNLNNNVTITGLAAGGPAVTDNQAGSVFAIPAGVTASISSLTIQDGGGYSGGGVKNQGTLTLSNGTITDNTAGYFGGGVYNAGTLILSNETITGNATDYSSGGGIYNAGTVTLTNSTVANNSAGIDNYYGYGVGGGGGMLNANLATATNCLFSGNSAVGSGGGIWNDLGTLTLNNSTVYNNNGANGYYGERGNFGGGGVGILEGEVTLNNDTIADNDATTGGGVYTLYAGTSMDNTIVAGNTASYAPDVCGTVDVANYSLIGTTDDAYSITSGANNQIGVSASLAGSLAYNNGGPTQTLALLPGSAAIGTGDPSQAGTTSQNGIVRPSTPDIGAYEHYSNRDWIVTDPNGNAGSGSPADITLPYAVANAQNGDSITFASDLSGDTITLNSTLTIDHNYTITGLGDPLAVSGNHSVEVFNVPAGVTTSISDLIIENGYASSGGGIHNEGTLTLTGDTLSSNTAYGYGHSGGGISNDHGTLTVSSSTLSGNSALDGNGSAIFNNYGLLTVTNSTFSDNYAEDRAGGIYNHGGTAMVSYSTFSGNSATYGGAIFNGGISFPGWMTLSNCTLSGNSASGYGGGIMDYTTVTLSNSTLANNYAANSGGGIWGGASLTLSDSTLSGNSAGYEGGGINIYLGAITLSNTIIAGNSAPDRPDLSNGYYGGTYYGGVTVTASYTLIGNDAGTGIAAGNGNVLDPAYVGLGALGNNGGATQTVVLLPGSAAIGAGDPGQAGTTAQNDVIRPAAPDIGAYQSLAAIVTTTADSGYGSLRQAILDANSAARAFTIDFDIPTADAGYSSGVWTITPLSPLPTITNTVNLDATTQPGFAGSPVIELNGDDAGSNVNGLTLTAGSSIIKGLDIGDFSGIGIRITGSTAIGDVVEGNYIGTNAAGSAAVANGYGVQIDGGASNNTIGGTTAATRNLISGNTDCAVYITGYTTTENVVEGNYIGTDSTGMHAVGNGYEFFSAAVFVFYAPDNTIGGSLAGDGNLISGNVGMGIWLYGNGDANTSYNTVAGNTIGLGSDGSTVIGNSGYAIYNVDEIGNVIGGTTAAARNVISGNQSFAFLESNGSGTTIKGNYIGTDATGTLARGNGSGVFAEDNSIIQNNVISGTGALSYGVYLSSGDVFQGNLVGTTANGLAALPNQGGGVWVTGADNIVGGTTAAERNVISGNASDGIDIRGSDGSGVAAADNLVEGNYIGVGMDGTTAISNTGDGIYLQNSPNNTIGGTGAGSANVISGNTGYGIAVDGAASTGNLVTNNYVGTGAGGSGIIANGSGALSVTNSAVVQAHGTFTGSVTDAGTIDLHGYGTVSASSANLASGGNLTVDISGSSPSVSSDLLDVSGSVALGGTSTLTLNLNGLNSVSGGPITIVSDGGQGGAQFSSVNVVNNPNNYSVIVAYTASTVTVTIGTPAPTVSPSTADLSANATTLTIHGSTFDPIPGNDTVAFNDGAAGTVTSATATTLTVTFTTQPVAVGGLTAVVTADSLTSGSPVQVATVTPVVTANSASMMQHTPTLTIHGYGFDPTASNNTVTFNDGAVGTVTSATATTLVVTFTTAPTAAGNLTAAVNTDSITSGAAVQVATVTFVNSVVVNGDYAPIVDISSNGSGTVTATTDGNNGFTAGNTVVISGYTGANAGYDGTFTVQSASGDQFTVTNATAGLPTLSGNSAGFAISQNTASALRGAQRSMVDSVVYTFTAPVSLTASNFTLTTSAPSVSGAPSSAPAPATLYPGMALTSLGGGSIWVVTWVSGGGTGASVTGHSLADGVYNITLGNSNEGTNTFYRLYGNIAGFNSINQTASLNNQDSLTFTHTYLLSTGAALYLADSDYDANGIINNTDSLNFTHRYLSVWSGFLPTI